jgi:AraC family transcriptional regulator
VTASDDTFVAFVDHLAEALDNPEARAWDRLHFSRFHFDRLIRGVAGESPAAFRRRILLERSAYRMITTRAPLLDIAVEAGYGSHEAFTRAFAKAFAKAFGLAPAAWRSRPTCPHKSGSPHPAASTSTRPAACGCRLDPKQR